MQIGGNIRVVEINKPIESPQMALVRLRNQNKVIKTELYKIKEMFRKIINEASNIKSQKDEFKSLHSTFQGNSSLDFAKALQHELTKMISIPEQPTKKHLSVENKVLLEQSYLDENKKLLESILKTFEEMAFNTKMELYAIETNMPEPFIVTKKKDQVSYAMRRRVE